MVKNSKRIGTKHQIFCSLERKFVLVFMHKTNFFIFFITNLYASFLVNIMCFYVITYKNCILRSKNFVATVKILSSVYKKLSFQEQNYGYFIYEYYLFSIYIFWLFILRFHHIYFYITFSQHLFQYS